MKILAIETSCDETSVAILKAEDFSYEILSNIVSSQIKIHKKWGGVVPTLAKREHQKNLVPVLKESLTIANLCQKTKSKIEENKLEELKNILKREPDLFKKTKTFLEECKKPEIDFIAVTIGPGLEPALWVGVNFVRALSFFWNIPIISVNHVKAHIIANWLDKKEIKDVFPAMSLVVSGGHTQLVLMNNFKEYEILGETRDDAAGECFDKTAKILGLGYPGGPIISKMAKEDNDKTDLLLPRPMLNTKDYDFSFSGLKTAVLYKHQKTKKRDKNYKKNMCFNVQQSIIDVLIHKTIKAAKEFCVKAIILGGGVVSNEELRNQFRKKILKELPNVKYLIPEIKFCTDNAAMIALTAYFVGKESATFDWKKIIPNANLKV